MNAYWHKQQEDLKRQRQEGIRNLQSLRIKNHESLSTDTLQDYSCMSQDEKTSVYFRDIEHHLITHMSRADVVLGCVAWLTSEPILAALARLKGVSLIVQKEDFLRPDLAERPNWSRRLRHLYDALPNTLYRPYITGTNLEHMSQCADQDLDPVRCVGNYNADKVPAFPRSHHKFVLFCRLNQRTEDEFFDPESPLYENCFYNHAVVPYAVWTGSFNFTKTAGASFENAIVLHDPNIVQAFYQEYAQITALSEPLDWGKPWAEPEWRIGT